MFLGDRHFIYPDQLAPEEVISMTLKALGGASANIDTWLDPRMDWQNFIWRVCFEWGVSPIWVLVSLQRERSLLGKPATERDFDYAQGVVGKDGPGTANPKWNGLPTQIMLSARTASWLGGFGPRENFGFRPGLWPNAPRWREGIKNTVQLYDKQHQPAGIRVAASKAEYIQLQFTPHIEVLEENGGIYQARIAPFFEAVS